MTKSPTTEIIPACIIRDWHSYDGIDHIIPAQVITRSKQERRCIGCGVEFAPRPSTNTKCSWRQRFCNQSCKTNLARAIMIARQAHKPNHLQEVIMDQIGRLVRRTSTEIYVRVVSIWGEISDRAVLRNLSRLVRDGRIVRTTDGYLLAPRPRQATAEARAS